MRKILFSILATLGLSAPAVAMPPIDFTTLGSLTTFNTAQNDTAAVGGITIDGFVYTGGTTFATDQGFLWLRNDSDDHGLGYCSEGASCGLVSTTGDGDFNELSNNNKTEIIRLTLPTGKSWSDIWVSSLDTGGTGSNETGTFYFSSSATPNLGTLTGITFSHNAVGFGSAVVEGSIFSYLVTNGFDVNSRYLFFRAGSFDSSGKALNGTNNDYLVYGAGVTAIPEPEIYAMLGIGLALMGFVGRRRQAAAA